MASIDSLLTLLIAELGELYDVERRLAHALPSLAETASSADLIDVLIHHAAETETQVERLEEAFAALEEPVETTACTGMRALISEGANRASERYEKKKLRDLAIVSAARQLEHYELAAYTAAITHALALGEKEVAALLEATLQEEKRTNRRLRTIGTKLVAPKRRVAARERRKFVDASRRAAIPPAKAHS